MLMSDDDACTNGDDDDAFATGDDDDACSATGDHVAINQVFCNV